MDSYRATVPNVGEQVREEIQRFESIHPYIYRAYSLIDVIPAETLRNQLEQQMIYIEDAFIRSQEWTLTRNVPTLRLGVVGSLDSGKTPLIHRYLTGGYRTRESVEGGRFKKDLVLEGRSHLLLIRDEGSVPPDFNFTHWLDGALVVFNVTNRESFAVAVHYLKAMANFRTCTDFPVILVGTQDSVSPNITRVVSEEEGKKCAREKNWTYMEVCSTTGHKVEQVFREVCFQIVRRNPEIVPRRDSRLNGLLGNGNTPMGSSSSRQRSVVRAPPTSNAELSLKANRRQPRILYDQPAIGHQRSMSAAPVYESNLAGLEEHLRKTKDPRDASKTCLDRLNGHASVPSARMRNREYSSIFDQMQSSTSRSHGSTFSASAADKNELTPLPYTRSVTSYNEHHSQSCNSAAASTSQLPTPTSTPNTQRKHYRRISNMFMRKETPVHAVETSIGSGRIIPVKQGILHKRGSTGLTWKKKYVCLFDDGKLCYYQNLKAFQEQSSHVKEIFLGLATVRVKSHQQMHKSNLQKRRSSLMNMLKPGKENMGPTVSAFSLTNSTSAVPSLTDRVSLASETGIMGSASIQGDGSSGGGISDFESGLMLPPGSTEVALEVESSKQKKKHRRLGSFGVRPNDDDEDAEFEIITSDQRRLEFAAPTVEERDEWVARIEDQIARALGSQSAESRDGRPVATKSETEELLRIPGNELCADCGDKNPCWAVINHGITICIECSGVHRKLGTHLSKVRSLELDQWPYEYITIMKRIGNLKANSIWEKNVQTLAKIGPNASPSERQKYIEDKYAHKLYLLKLPSCPPVSTQLLEAVRRADFDSFIRILPRCTSSDLETQWDGGRTVAHYAASMPVPEFLLLLSWNQADCTKRDRSGCSALDCARRNPDMNPHVLSEVTPFCNSTYRFDLDPSTAEEASLSSSNSNNNIPNPSISVSDYLATQDLFLERDTSYSDHSTTIHKHSEDEQSNNKTSFLSNPSHSVI